MKTATAYLTQQSRVAVAAARCLRDMSCGQPNPDDLRAVATALEQSVRKLLQLAFVIENGVEGER